MDAGVRLSAANTSFGTDNDSKYSFSVISMQNNFVAAGDEVTETKYNRAVQFKVNAVRFSDLSFTRSTFAIRNRQIMRNKPSAQ